jgi:hypothetical protein
VFAEVIRLGYKGANVTIVSNPVKVKFETLPGVN